MTHAPPPQGYVADRLVSVPGGTTSRALVCSSIGGEMRRTLIITNQDAVDAVALGSSRVIGGRAGELGALASVVLDDVQEELWAASTGAGAALLAVTEIVSPRRS